MNLEDDLRRALQREPAPPDFAARVLARARPPRRFPLAIAAAVAVAVLVPSGVYQYRQHQKAEAQRIAARDQLIVALSITRDTLQHVQQQIQHNTRHAQ